MQDLRAARRDVVEEFPDLELNGQSLEVVKNFCYLCVTLESILARIRNGCIKFRSILPVSLV